MDNVFNPPNPEKKWRKIYELLKPHEELINRVVESRIKDLVDNGFKIHGLKELIAVGYSLALEDSPAHLPVRECYQWVKASERLPEKEGLYVIRNAMAGIVGGQSFFNGERFEFLLFVQKDIEWLEQVTLPATEAWENNGPEASNSI